MWYLVRGDKIENETGEARTSYGVGERRVQGFWCGNVRERDY